MRRPSHDREAVPAVRWRGRNAVAPERGPEPTGPAVRRRQPVQTSPEVTLMSNETEIHPFHVDLHDEAIADLRRRIAATRWPTRELAADRSHGVQLATIQELARYWTTDHDWRLRGDAERAAAVHLPDRRAGRPLHPRHVAARECAAADHHARLARLGPRVARGHRPAHRPDRAWRLRRGRVRLGAAVPGQCRDQLAAAGIRPKLRTVLADARYVSEETFARADQDKLRLLAPLAKDPGRPGTRLASRVRHLDQYPGHGPGCPPGSTRLPEG